MTRPCTVFHYVLKQEKDESGAVIKSGYEKEEQQKGVFHEWGSDYEEFENGAGNHSVAIIELPDGTVITPNANLIRFDDVEIIA